MTSTDLDTAYELPEQPPATELQARGEQDIPPYPSVGQPKAVARRLRADLFTHPGTGASTLVWWRGLWWKFDGVHWQRLPDDQDVKGPVWDRLERVTIEGKDDAEVPWFPTTAKVGNLMEPLQLESRLHPSIEAPAWIAGHQEHPAADQFVTCRNGALHLPTRELIEHTPQLFSTWGLSFDYDPAATCPQWDQFLAETFAHDPAGVDLLQEWAGYLISGRLDLHKALLLVGPPRSGKGTISRILKKLVGESNTTSPSLHSLGSEFGLAPLIGKPFAVIEDARGAGPLHNLTTERLLNVIGQDQVSANVKNRDYWTGTLPTRFMLVSNEVPRFLDASGAIATRFVSLELQHSFVGREDIHLGARLAGELSGILNWALAGLERLQRQGRFTATTATGEVAEMLEDMAAPVAAFIREHYTATGDQGDIIPLKDVHGHYRTWCELEGAQPVAQMEFMRRLRAAKLPGVKAKHTRRRDGSLPPGRYVFGLKQGIGHDVQPPF